MMETCFKVAVILSSLLAVLSAPYPLPQDTPQGPFAAIGNLITRLQSSFSEGSNSIRQSNGIFPLPGSSTTSTTTTTTTTAAPPTTSAFGPATNPFNSINAILDNIGRSTSNSLGNGISNNIFGNVPGRSLDTPFTTPAPLPPLTTTRSPFDLEGINQGINAFFQAFIKTNIEKLFKQGQEQKHSITTRSDDFQSQPKPLNLGDIIINSLFKRPQ